MEQSRGLLLSGRAPGQVAIGVDLERKKLAHKHSTVSCANCPCLFLRKFLMGNFYFGADGDVAVEFSLRERFHGWRRTHVAATSSDN
jgi:hypothetical protein